MRTSNPKGRAPKPLTVGLAALLILALNLPALAVVFTNPAPITINDPPTVGVATPYPSNITVSGLGNVTDVNVTISNLNHTFVDDVDILLVGPNPATQKFVLMSDAGGDPDLNNVTITFDDSAATKLPDSAAIPSGTFQPTNFSTAADTFLAPAPAAPWGNHPGTAAGGTGTLAATFNGGAANGTWSLYVVDDAAGDVGIIADGWSLTITSDMGSGTFSNTAGIRIDDRMGRATPYPSTISVTGLTGTITDVNVTLTNMNHAFPSDIAVQLVSPTGRNIILMSGAVGDDLSPLTNTTITFDDSAGAVLPNSGGVGAGGSFRPATYAIVDFPAPSPLFPPTYPTFGGSATLASAFNGTNPNGTWSLYVVDMFTPDPGNINGGWSIDITAGGTTRRITRSDFDGDGRSDVSVWNPTTRNWSIRDSSTYKYRNVIDWGTTGDILVPGDYDGDGRTDLGVYRPSEGNWYIQQSTGMPLVRIVNWGLGTDIPVPADYNNDGRTDFAVWRPSDGNWYALNAAGGGGLPVVGWGAAGDIPVPGDYDGDGTSDAAIFRPSEQNWYIRNSSGGVTVRNWGQVDPAMYEVGDQLVPADYDGDGRTDIAVWRSTTGVWFIIRSSNGTVQTRLWGQLGDTPVPADYDGDQKADMAVWRGTEGNWHILQSAISGITPDNRRDTLGLAASGAIPTPTGYIP